MCLDNAQGLEGLRTQRALVGSSVRRNIGTAMRRGVLLKLRRTRERLGTPGARLGSAVSAGWLRAVHRQRSRGPSLVSRRYVPFLRRRRSVLAVFPAAGVVVDQVTFECLGVPQFLPPEGVDA